MQAAMGPLLEVACDRLAFVLRRLFELALLRRRDEEAAAGGAGAAGGPGSVPTPFQTTLRRAHDRFVADLASRCKVRQAACAVGSCCGLLFTRSSARRLLEPQVHFRHTLRHVSASPIRSTAHRS